ncbi:MAG: hypothetical protein KHW86_17210 [Porphyromonadaceae bacterium]|nr:hypothetical protein [Porphyromonadaceae bacterium]
MTREEGLIAALSQRLDTAEKDIETLKELVTKLNNDNGNTRKRKSKPAGENTGAEKQDN